MTSWPGFQVEHEQRAGAAWLLVAGELDIDTAERLADAIAQAAASSASVVLDLSAVTFCDSSGLAALLHARRAHPQMTLVPGDAVLHVAKLACVDEALFGEQIIQDEDDQPGQDAVGR